MMAIEKLNPILRAAQFAHQAHKGQRRKYNGRPYIEHPARVAARVTILPGATEAMVVAAWLHDVVEDTTVELDEIADLFGVDVAGLAGELTNPSKGSSVSRAERKAQDRKHLACVSREAQLIKLLDRIDNLSEMDGGPREFVSIYLDEFRLLVEAIGDADQGLKLELLDTIAAAGGIKPPQSGIPTKLALSPYLQVNSGLTGGARSVA